MCRPVLMWSAVTGFGLAGLFDGIVLHRILGWHHLLSHSAAAAPETTQRRWDGDFDAAMWVLVVLGLIGVFRHPTRLSVIPPTGMTGAVLAGFGGWHMADAVLAHWLLGLHRIRPGATDPLFWDLVWTGAFGVLPIATALVLSRRPVTPPLAASDGTSPATRRFHGNRRLRKGPPHAHPRS